MAYIYLRAILNFKFMIYALISTGLVVIFANTPFLDHQLAILGLPNLNIKTCNFSNSANPSPPPAVHSPVKYRIGVFTIGLGKPYLRWAMRTVVMSEVYVCPNRDYVRVEYFIFSNHNITDVYGESAPYGLDMSRVHIVYKEKKGWPLDSDRRYEFMADTIEEWEKKLNASNSMQFTNYVWTDTDNLFVGEVCEELLANLVGLSHARVNPLSYPYETRKESAAYTDPYFQQYLPYFSAHIFAGKSKHFKRLVNELAANTIRDRGRGINAKVDDESHLNSYFTRHVPTSILSRAFVYPELRFWGHETGDGILDRKIYDKIYAMATYMVNKPWADD